MILLVIIYELRGDNCDRLGIGHALELAPVFQVLALRFSTFTRATRYFQIATTVAIPNLIESFHDKRLRGSAQRCGVRGGECPASALS